MRNCDGTRRSSKSESSSAVERDLLETARLTALAVADDYELRADPDAGALGRSHELG